MYLLINQSNFIYIHIKKANYKEMGHLCTNYYILSDLRFLLMPKYFRQWRQKL